MKLCNNLNMYTGLASLLVHLASVSSPKDVQKVCSAILQRIYVTLCKVLMFSYGSGLAATAYMLSIDTKVGSALQVN